jgi:hypothetical protein
MLVRCIKKKAERAEVDALGEYYKKSAVKYDAHLSIGRTYVVLGLVMNTANQRMPLGVSLTVLCDYGHIESYPLILFEVIDGAVDAEWVIRTLPNGTVEAAPKLMQSEHFAEDHLDGVPEVVRTFRELYKRIEQRATTTT